MLMQARTRKVLALVWLVGTGCSVFGPGDCVAVGRPGVQVAVSDSVLGTRPTVPVVVTLSEADYVETWATPDSTTPSASIFFGARARTGTYVVTVTGQGYREWSQSQVIVRRSGRCDDIQQVKLVARLQRI